MPSWKKVITSGSAASFSSISTSGQVAIGTSLNTNYALQLQQPTGTNKDYIQGIQDNGSNVAFRIDTDSGDNVSLRLYNGSGAQKIHLNAVGTSTFEGSVSGSSTSTGSFGAISVKNGGSPQIFGNSNGIGINTTDIDHDLDIQGTLRVSDAIHGFHDTTGRVYQRKWIQFGPNVEHHASATDRDITFFNNQTTDNPVLKVGGGSGYTSRVGINQRTPSATLDVVGNVEVSSHITVVVI